MAVQITSRLPKLTKMYTVDIEFAEMLLSWCLTPTITMHCLRALLKFGPQHRLCKAGSMRPRLVLVLEFQRFWQLNLVGVSHGNINFKSYMFQFLKTSNLCQIKINSKVENRSTTISDFIPGLSKVMESKYFIFLMRYFAVQFF